MRERGRGGPRRERAPARLASKTDLAASLHAFDGQGYGAYKALRGASFPLGPFRLTFDHVQGDPFAAPSRVVLEFDASLPGLSADICATGDRRRAAADFFLRLVSARLSRPGTSRGGGSGKSGRIGILAPGPQVLDRTAFVLDPDGGGRVRLTVGLPAAGRRILGREAADLVARRLPEALADVLAAGRYDTAALQAHIEAVEDQVALRAALEDAGLIAFLADGAVLPRRSGVDPQPLREAVPLAAPPALAVELEAPHAGRLRGLGIRCGITLIVGGGYHGKSTLLDSLAHGVHDHMPGDGREACVTQAAAVCVRAEDGRSVAGVDLRPFIHDLPLGRDAAVFETADASGSTSQAAAIVESLEAGATALLIDEDTAATNFMIRDARMRRLVPAAREPITPFIDRVRQLSEDHGVSSVLVVGGAGDYLDVADCVIRMDTYRPQDASAEAAEVRASLPLDPAAAPQPPGPWPAPSPRVPQPDSLDPSRGRRAERVRSHATRGIEFGSEEVDLSLVAQLVDPAQARLIGDLLLELSRGGCDGQRSLAELLDRFEAALAAGGIEAVAEPGFGDRAVPRRFEFAAALNRLRSLRCV